ncbi:MAG TPA: AlpA family transcriptional regulator [Fibrobacteria bacterium]|nr:AlpA family transcriptional regulator [Fibrobacteria bacterium]
MSTESTALSRLIAQSAASKAVPTAAPSRLVRRRDVEAMTGLPKSTLYDYLQDGRFPSPVKLSARSVAWHLSDVQAWIDSRVSARPNQKAA